MTLSYRVVRLIITVYFFGNFLNIFFVTFNGFLSNLPIKVQEMWKLRRRYLLESSGKPQLRR